MKPETRFTELRIEGTGQLAGILMRYGDVANLPFGKERFERGSFQFDDVILNSMHQREVPLARTGGGGLELQDSPDSLSMRAVLPDTAAARDTLTLVRSGVLRGLSVEFQALEERQEQGLRIIEKANLTGLGVVDKGAYADSVVQARMEVRQTGKRRIEGAFFYEKLVVVDDGGALQNRLHHNTDQPVTRKRKVTSWSIRKVNPRRRCRASIAIGQFPRQSNRLKKRRESLVLADLPDSLGILRRLAGHYRVVDGVYGQVRGRCSISVLECDRLQYRISPIADADRDSAGW